MKRNSQRRPDDWTALGELDEIVDRLFDDLDGTGSVARRANKALQPAAAAPHADRRAVDVPPVDSAEAMSSLPRRSAGSDEIDGAEEREVASGAAEPDAQACSLSREEADFIAHAVDWLAPRPNAERLLERIRSSLPEQDAEADFRATADASDRPRLPPGPKDGL
jgi:hypothetical protein